MTSANSTAVAGAELNVEELTASYDDQVVLHGISVHGRQVAKTGICYIPQGRGVFPDISVADNLGISVGRDPARRERVFEYFPVLRGYARRPAGTLSGGEQQMLAMAPALVGDCRLVLVDELSLGLAPKVVEALFLLLAEIRQR